MGLLAACLPLPTNGLLHFPLAAIRWTKTPSGCQCSPVLIEWSNKHTHTHTTLMPVHYFGCIPNLTFTPTSAPDWPVVQFHHF